MSVTITPREEQLTSEFARLFEETSAGQSFEQGQLVKGKVIQITKDYVVVDVGFKSEGQIPVVEFLNAQGELTVDAGDTVEVLLEGIDDENGTINLSKDRADTLKAWDTLVEVQEKDDMVEGLVLTKVRGGFMVDVGVKAFLPASQLDIRPVRNLDKYVGKRFRFKILKLNKLRGNIVLSRKIVLEKEREGLKDEILKNLKEGQVLDGVVKNVTDYGVFVDLGGLDGLVHVTDLSWGRVNHPSDLFDVGDDIRVVILKYEEGTGRVSLGVKQLASDPWTEVEGKFPVGSRVKGKVVNLTDYGAFIELAQGIEGLIHVSEMSWNKKLKSPSQILKTGEEVEAIILDLDASNRRISLGMKQLKPNPWDVLDSKFPVGSKAKGVVRNITDFGLFVDVGAEVDGLVHISDLCWVQTFEKPQEIYNKGDEVEVVVLHLDRENERFSLGVKQLQENVWGTIHTDYPAGTEAEGKVTALTAGGAVVSLPGEVQGRIRKEDLPKECKVGDKLLWIVKEISEETRTFTLKPSA